MNALHTVIIKKKLQGFIFAKLRIRKVSEEDFAK